MSVCSLGEVCLWKRPFYTGGLYHYGGDDRNLANDQFENEDTTVVVANNASSVINNGTVCGGCDGVVTFAGTFYTGTVGCVPRGYQLTTSSDAANYKIASFFWGRCS